jgi:hypothetical protein
VKRIGDFPLPPNTLLGQSPTLNSLGIGRDNFFYIATNEDFYGLCSLVELYQSSKSNVSEHIKHIFEEGELDESSVVRKFRTTASDGKN